MKQDSWGTLQVVKIRTTHLRITRHSRIFKFILELEKWAIRGHLTEVGGRAQDESEISPAKYEALMPTHPLPHCAPLSQGTQRPQI